MLNSVNNLNDLSYTEYQQYARQIIIKEIKEEGQNRLRQAKVICVGAGGLNASAMMYLAACGIGEIGIIDDDIVELSNLQRQLIYKNHDINKKKVEAAHINLSMLNQSTKITSYSKKLTKKNIVRVISGYEIVIDGTDDFKTRYLISQYCYKLHKIHIYGAIDQFTGQVSVLNYQNSLSYYSMLDKISYGKMQRCNETGVINTLAGIIGLLQATETIKIIIGIGHLSCNQLTLFNFLDCSLNKVRIKPSRLIGRKARTKSIKNVNIGAKYLSVKKAFSGLGKQYILIDIRTEIEFKLGHANHAINMPLDSLKKASYIQQIKKLLSQYKIIIYCNNMARSYIASKVLHKYSIDHYILDSKSLEGKRGIRTLVK